MQQMIESVTPQNTRSSSIFVTLLHFVTLLGQSTHTGISGFRVLRLRVSLPYRRSLKMKVQHVTSGTKIGSDQQLYGCNSLSARKNAQVRAFAVESLA